MVAYTVSGGACLSAYDPDCFPNSDEGAYYFSETRYGYKDQESRTGLIITDSQNYYDMPRDWTQDKFAPDQEHYRNPASPRPSEAPASMVGPGQGGHLCTLSCVKSCLASKPSFYPNSLKSSPSACPNSLNS